ncbi:hypothetical protein X754_27000 [Mesorhizobium sp. LNJC403B00]|nr:hypothetical protein X754_27000 [Mesorhizobium sp. LNJC403B00]
MRGAEMVYTLAMTFLALYGICGAVAILRKVIGR